MAIIPISSLELLTEIGRSDGSVSYFDTRENNTDMFTDTFYTVSPTMGKTGEVTRHDTKTIYLLSSDSLSMNYWVVFDENGKSDKLRTVCSQLLKFRKKDYDVFWLIDGINGVKNNILFDTTLKITTSTIPNLIINEKCCRLYLTDMHIASKKDIMKKLDITYIVDVSNTLKTLNGEYTFSLLGDNKYSVLKNGQKDPIQVQIQKQTTKQTTKQTSSFILQKFEGISYYQVNAEDLADDPTLFQNMGGIYDFIHNAIGQPHESCDKSVNILIHCQLGVSRSATIVIYYLMRKYKWSLLKCWNYVKLKRPQIMPNEQFKKKLIETEKTLFGSTSITVENWY